MKTQRPAPYTSDHFQTYDLALAAFLVVLKQPLLATHRNGQRCTFVFPASAQEKAARFFQPGSDLVSAREFHQVLRELRGLARGVAER